MTTDCSDFICGAYTLFLPHTDMGSINSIAMAILQTLFIYRLFSVMIPCR